MSGQDFYEGEDSYIVGEEQMFDTSASGISDMEETEGFGLGMTGDEGVDISAKETATVIEDSEVPVIGGDAISTDTVSESKKEKKARLKKEKKEKKAQKKSLKAGQNQKTEKQDTIPGNNRKQRGVSLSLKIMLVSIGPLVIIGAILCITGIMSVQSGMRQEVTNGLMQEVEAVQAVINASGTGDYALSGKNDLMKGSYNVTANTSALDRMVEDNDVELTIFFDKTRRVTTIKDAEGNRIIGTDCSDEIYQKVVKNGEVYTSYDAKIDGKTYYACYVPMENMDGSIAGMFFAGQLASTVDSFVLQKSLAFAAVAIIGIIIAIVLVGFVVIHIRKALIETNAVISELSEGELNAVVPAGLLKRSDELGDMARGVDQLQKRLLDVMEKVSSAANVLMDAGEELNSLATQTSNTADEISHAVEDISRGAVSQADEIEHASANIAEMGGMISKIVNSVSTLDGTSEQMKDAGDQSTRIIQELSASNDRTMDAIRRIGEQVYATNESAKHIGDAIQLITSIAEETNLLSLNASIEAARAGEQGRGFAVVANQIQKLAEQSNESAQRVGEIIDNLLKESDQTVAVMDEVEVIVNEQQEKLIETRKEFSHVQTGINTSKEETSGIKDQTTVCDSARVKVIDVISNLSAISQQNAASTEQTTASMEELNATINLLAESAGNLTELATTLEEQIEFFKFEKE